MEEDCLEFFEFEKSGRFLFRGFEKGSFFGNKKRLIYRFLERLKKMGFLGKKSFSEIGRLKDVWEWWDMGILKEIKAVREGNK